MHPLSIFPSLLTFGLLAPFLLRVGVGLFIILFGWERFNKPYKLSSIIYFATGIMLMVGLYTQVVVIIGIILIKFDYFVDRKFSPISKDKMIIYFLVAVILLSLLVTGPGLFAFDLPL